MRKPFYGWIIVGVSFLIGFTESGVFQNVLSIFMKPMVEELGWTRASITGAIAFGSICGGLLSVVVGPILDRYGPRRMAFLGILILSIGLGAMTFATELWQLYLFFGVGRMIAVGVLSLARPFQYPTGFFVRGRAMGITKIGERLGSTLLPLLIQFAILALGWRLAWGTLGAVVFFMSGIPALVFLRHRPENMGLLPDGALPAADTGGSAHPASKENPVDASGDESEPVWTRRQAMRNKAFWVATLLNSLIPFSQAGLNFHFYPFLTDQGLSETTAVFVLSTFGAFGMAGSVIWGMLAERMRVQKLLAMNIIGNGLIFLLLYWAVLFKFGGVSGIGIIFLLAALHGVFHGGRHPLIPIIWANFFGRRSLGSISGLANPFYLTANAIGPIFAGFCFDLLGNYSFPFYFFIAVYVVAGMITLRMRPPKYPAENAGG